MTYISGQNLPRVHPLTEESHRESLHQHSCCSSPYQSFQTRRHLVPPLKRAQESPSTEKAHMTPSLAVWQHHKTPFNIAPLPHLDGPDFVGWHQRNDPIKQFNPLTANREALTKSVLFSIFPSFFILISQIFVIVDHRRDLIRNSVPAEPQRSHDSWPQGCAFYNESIDQTLKQKQRVASARNHGRI